MNFKMKDVNSKGVNPVPYRPVRLEYTVPASKPVYITPLFRTEKNTDRTSHVPANFGQYRPVPGVSASTKKKVFFFFFKFCNF